MKPEFETAFMNYVTVGELLRNPLNLSFLMSKTGLWSFSTGVSTYISLSFPQADMEIVRVIKGRGHYLGFGFRISKEFIYKNDSLHSGGVWCIASMQDILLFIYIIYI